MNSTILIAAILVIVILLLLPYVMSLLAPVIAVGIVLALIVFFGGPLITFFMSFLGTVATLFMNFVGPFLPAVLGVLFLCGLFFGFLKVFFNFLKRLGNELLNRGLLIPLIVIVAIVLALIIYSQGI